ncbi:MAG: LapA family protein [Myxococcota bacterium]|jgi:uncharacterized integral membrane protein|nr:LapA family protein [Myxococcota bacterium]
MRWLRRLFVIGLFVGLLVGGWQFAGQNQQPVEIDYLAGQLPGVPLWQVPVVAGALGVVVVFFPMTLSLMRARLEGRRYRKAIRLLEKELAGLRPEEGDEAEGIEKS